MRIKLTIIAIITAVFIAPYSFADNVKTTTSKSYVDTQIATKQDKVPAVDTNTVITTTNTTGEIGEKAIYNASGNYAEQTDALVTAADANAAVQNAIDTEFVCVEWAPNTEPVPENCYIWQIRAAHTATLPSAYTALEYLESTGTQYINSGILQTNNIGVSVKYAWTQFVASSYIFGSYHPHYYLGINSSFTTMLGSYGPTLNNVVISVPISSVSVGTTYQYNINLYNSGTTQFVGINTRQLEPKTFTSSRIYLYLFAANDGNGSAKYYSKSRIYNMKITDGTTLVRDFIPVRRKSDGELGMYDLVSNQFFTNAGSGTFVAGPVASYIPQNQ